MKADPRHRCTEPRIKLLDKLSKCLFASLGFSCIKTWLGVSLIMDPVFWTGVEIHQHLASLASLASLGALMIKLALQNVKTAETVTAWLHQTDWDWHKVIKVSQYDRGWGWSYHDKHWSLWLSPSVGHGRIVRDHFTGPRSIVHGHGLLQSQVPPLPWLNVYIRWSQWWQMWPGRDSACILTTTQGLRAQERRADRWERSGVHRSTNTITSPPISGGTQNIREKIQILLLCWFYVPTFSQPDGHGQLHHGGLVEKVV